MGIPYYFYHLTNKYKVKINELKYSIDESLKEKEVLENE